MSDFKNKLIEKYTEYFIQNNPSYSKDDQATIDFCNAKLEQFYVPYVSYIETKRKISKDKEVELENIKTNTSVSYSEQLLKIGILCSMSIFSERPSLKIYTDELTGFDGIRYYFNIEEFENSIIPFLEYDIETNFLDLLNVLELSRVLKLRDTILAKKKKTRNDLKKDIYNDNEKRKYGAKQPRKKNDEIAFDTFLNNSIGTNLEIEDEVKKSIFYELKSDVKSKIGMNILRNILEKNINNHKGVKGFSKSKFYKSIQKYIYLLFDDDQNGIKRKENFDELNSRRREDEYEGDYNRYYNKRIESLVFKK